MHNAMDAQLLIERPVLGVTGHEVWDSVSMDVSAPVLMSGAVSAWGVLALLASTAAAPTRDGGQAEAGQVERSISLFLTVLPMAAWMFVNWRVPLPARCLICTHSVRVRLDGVALFSHRLS